MLMNLLFGTYRERAMRVLLLHPESTYHVRELARLTNTAAGTLHKELARLAAAGLLLREKQGNQIRYQANRQCPIFAELTGMFRKTTGLAFILADALQPLATRIQCATVFGSIARGDATAASDIDLLIIGGVGFTEVVQCLHDTQVDLGREINPVIYSMSEFIERLERQDPFIQQILQHPSIDVLGEIHDLGKSAEDQSAAKIYTNPGRHSTTSGFSSAQSK